MVETDDKEQKTEEPTSKRLSDARKEGNLPVSREFSSLVMVIAIFLMALWLAIYLGNAFVMTLRVFLEKPEQISIHGGGFQDALLGVASGVAFPLATVLGIFVFMAFMGTMLQTSFYVGTGKLKLDFKKVNPVKGLKQIFSMNIFVELFKSFFKMVVLGFVAYWIISGAFETLPKLPEVMLFASLDFFHDVIVKLMAYFLFVVLVIAIADITYVRYQYFKNLRMTKQEVKDEHKQMEGDPMVRGRLRQIRMEKARKRMMAKVPNASVVIINPTHYAVALEYDRSKMMAPVVTAKGVDFLAARIREVAEEHEIPLVSNPPLARALHDTVDVDDPIDAEHYRAVAEVISYVYKLKNKEGKS